ncbi:MAG TPA: LysM peptidoglycan-binding domain-containing protein [Candidatus Saccharimonadales bacterium]|nr:LysM peptidoglycan-binding domain-containing protein [Candidatus Saccharimonadales bacterium]
MGKGVQAAGIVAAKLAAAPRILAHAGIIMLVGATVLSGSTGHSAKLSPVAQTVGYGSVLDQAASADVAAKVADQTNLIVTQEVDTSAKSLNEFSNITTVDDGTLAKNQVVDTAGTASRGVVSYAVKPGDTLGSIATDFNVTSDTIRWANNISDDTLKTGQNLSILPVSGVQVKVGAGDTPESLASKYQANADQIIAFNNAEVSGLKAGQSIIIPDGVIAQPVKTTTAVAAAPKAATVSRSNFIGGPNGYAYGYCTWYVANRRAVPSDWGNAVSWYYNAQISGYSVGSTPRPGAIAWTGGGYYGHVAYVESVSGGNVTVSEMNYNGNWNRVTTRTVSASTFRYIY